MTADAALMEIFRRLEKYYEPDDVDAAAQAAEDARAEEDAERAMREDAARLAAENYPHTLPEIFQALTK